MASNNSRVSSAVVKRLPGYYRYLGELEREGMVRISSQELGVRMGLTASQIRQDINCFGGFGQQGYGYNVGELKRRIGDILGLNRGFRMVVVGAGNIGSALAKYSGFRQLGFSVDALFDSDDVLVGQEVDGIPVLPADALESYLAGHRVEVGIIAAPASSAQQVCDRLVAGGVRAIWNYAPVDLSVPEGVAIQSIHLSDSLMVLSYYMREQGGRI